MSLKQLITNQENGIVKQSAVHSGKSHLISFFVHLHWTNLNDHARFAYLVRDAVHWHWTSLLSLREAVLSYPSEEQEEVKQQVFCDSARKLFGFQ